MILHLSSDLIEFGLKLLPAAVCDQNAHLICY